MVVSTKKSYLFMCTRWLLINDSKKYSVMYSQAAYNIKIDIGNIENNNEMDVKEKENIKSATLQQY